MLIATCENADESLHERTYQKPVRVFAFFWSAKFAKT